MAQKIIGFSKKMYSEIGGQPWNTTHELHVSQDLQNEFDLINDYTKGELGHTLTALAELRMLDLQMSILRARKMRDAVQQFVLEARKFQD